MRKPEPLSLVELEANVRADLADGWDPRESVESRWGPFSANALQEVLLGLEYECVSPEGALLVGKLVLEHGVHPDDCKRVHSWEGLPTPLSMAICRQHAPLVKLFLENGADPNLPDHKGISTRPPLSWAVVYGNNEICAALLEHGADPNAVYRSPLKGSFPPLESREELNFRGNIEDYHGLLECIQDSPLHQAAVSGNSTACRLLLEHGADPALAVHVFVSSEDDYGGWDETPAQAADRSGHPDTARFIRAFINEKFLTARLTHAEAEITQLRGERDQLKGALQGVLAVPHVEPAAPSRRARL